MRPFPCKKKLNKFLVLFIFACLSFLALHCSSSNSAAVNPPDDNPPEETPSQNAACAGSTSPLSSSIIQPASPNGITFTPVGSAFPESDLIDLEFLPSQNGDAIVIGQGGAVYYMRNNFEPLNQVDSIEIESGGERGLLAVAADPLYASNCYVYFYFTAPGGNENQVSRATVNVNLSNNTFSLNDLQSILQFSKSDSPSPGSNHNGGGLVFENENNLFIGVGDGGGAGSTDLGAAIGQDGSTRLGKILRIVPNRSTGQGGYSLPAEGNNAGASLPEIYSLGLRNPFTLDAAPGALFIGDVGAGSYEEINRANGSAVNFGWPLEEGPGASFTSPIGGYNHSSDLDQNNNEDPEDNPGSLGDGRSIMLGEFYEGSQYNGFLDNRLIYSEFYQGWVRALQLDSNGQVLGDSHLGHLQGMSSLQMGPDGYLYAVSLYGSDQILRLDLVP